MKMNTPLQSVIVRFVFSFIFILSSAFFSLTRAQIITTIAGNGTAANAGDGGPATAAELNSPVGLAGDASGNIYIAAGARIRKVTSSGTISTFAGMGFSGFSGNGGQATAAELSGPADVVVDASGNVYIADAANARIRKVNTSGIISTYAGTTVAGFSGDGGPATAAELNNPLGIAVDISGNVYIAEQGNDRVRMISTSGIISTIAGTGTHGYSGDSGPATAAELFFPYGVAIDSLGNVYIADEMNFRIRMVSTSGIISTFAGNGVGGSSGNGGPATAAELDMPTGVRQDGLRNIYIVDNGTARIRKVNTSGVILSVAGSGTSGFSGDAGQATAAKLSNPRKVAFDNVGNLYIADDANERIRIVYLTLNVVATVTGNVSCNGGSTGSASVIASNGTTPYTYSWSGGQTTSSVTSLSAGTYTATVTDLDGVKGSATVTITQPTALTVSASVTANVSCNGGTNGSVSSTPSSGTSPYTYSWSGGGTNSTKTGLTAGTYTITITDNNGCSATASTTITQPTTGLTVSASVTTNVTCGGGSNGSVSSSPSGGSSPYTYSWSSGGTNATKTGLTAGIYTITVTDINSCTGTASATITQPPILTISFSPVNVSCNGLSNGVASATPSGGTSPYTYSWSTGATNSSITGLSIGTYSITVTDIIGCTTTASVTITQPATLAVSASVTTNISCNNGSNGVVSATPSGGTSAYTYSWSNGATSSSASGLSVGTYSITVTDAHGCTATSSVALTNPALLTAAITASTNATCYGESDGSATVTAAGGTGTDTYSWSPSGGTSATATGLAAGTYTVTVTDANSCTATANVTITQPPCTPNFRNHVSSNVFVMQ
jgi:hypothetical protein